MKRIQWVPIFGYIAVIGLVFGRVLFLGQGFLIFGDDIHRQYFFYRQFFNDWLRQGIFPWWNPYLFGGEPFIANPLINIWYPANWLFSILPLNIAYSWHLALHVFWAMLGMYCVLAAMSNVKFQMSNVSAWVGGVVFGLSGFFMARVWAGHVDVIAAASWVPWVVGAFYTLLRAEVANKNLDPASSAGQNFVGSPRRISFVIAAGVFAMQLLAGYQTMAFFTCIAVGIVALLHCYIVKSVKPFFLAGLAGVALAAIQIVPEQEFFRQSIRTFSLPYSWISYGSYTWKSLVQLINPFYFGNQLTYRGPPPNFIEHSAFIGLGGLALVISALTAQKKCMARLLFGAIALFGLWVSLGPHAPVDLQKFLWKIVPMYHYLRIPPRHLILVVFGLSGLAAIGLSSIKNRTVQMTIGAAVVVEMVVFARTFIVRTPLPQTRYDSELIRLLTQDKQPFRLLQNFGVWLPQRDALDFDSVMSYGIFSATGYDPSILRTYYEYIAQASGTSGAEAVLSHDVQVPYLNSTASDTLDFLNIKYLMVPTQHDPFIGSRRYHLVREDKNQDHRLYENTTVKPRFFFTDPACGTADISSYTPNRVVLRTNASCPGTLISSEVWYPGWHAIIDGKEVTITKLHNTFRTLFVPDGKHTIMYVYIPTVFYVSASISFITACALLWWIRKSR